jgi:hypothetical protein
MPVFEGLFPDPAFEELVQDVIYISATWHTYAKMRMHTDSTLGRLCKATQMLCHLLRRFSCETKELKIQELNKEKEACACCKAKKAAKKQSEGKAPVPAILATVGNAVAEAVYKVLNLFTYKFHALGNYVASIMQLGTTGN